MALSYPNSYTDKFHLEWGQQRRATLEILDFIYLGINDLRVVLLSDLVITNTHIIGIILKNTIFAFVMAKLFLNNWHSTTESMPANQM